MATLRLQMRQWRLLIWLGTAGLAGLAGWQLWQVFQKFRAHAYEPKGSAEFDKLIRSAIGTIKEEELKKVEWKDYNKLLTCPFNGFLPPEPEVAKVEEPKDVVPPPKKIGTELAVAAVTYAPADLGRVVVKYTDGNLKPTRDEIVLRVGAALTPPYDAAPFNGKLKRIEPEQAIFDWCGEEVSVHPTRKEEAEKAAADANVPTHPVDPSLSDAQKALLEKHADAKDTINDGKGNYLLGSSDLDRYGKKADEILNEARITETPGPDGKKEVTVGGLRNNTYLARTYGLQQGDAILSINGVPVTSKNQALNWARQNNNLEKYVVVMRQKGREVTKTILVPRNKK